jgi:hypothetical protein
VCTQLGAVLAGVHRSTADMAMWPSRAVGILGLPVSMAEACLDRQANTQALMRFIADDSELGTMLNTGAAAYTARCVIHGDIRQENWLIDDREQDGLLKFFDWELAGSGDPAWDLGSLVARPCSTTSASQIGNACEAHCQHRSRSPCVRCWRPLQHVALLDPASSDTWRKVALYACTTAARSLRMYRPGRGPPCVAGHGHRQCRAAYRHSAKPRRQGNCRHGPGLISLSSREADAVDAPLSSSSGRCDAALDELSALASRHGPDAQIDVLADWLYVHWYSCPAVTWACAQIPPGRANLVPALRAALAATGRWETGWVALQVMPDNACLAGRGQLTRIVASGDYGNVARPGVPVAPGDGLAVLDRLDWVDEPTGFWSARSLEAEPAHPFNRLLVGRGTVSAMCCVGLYPCSMQRTSGL